MGLVAVLEEGPRKTYRETGVFEGMKQSQRHDDLVGESSYDTYNSIGPIIGTIDGEDSNVSNNVPSHPQLEEEEGEQDMAEVLLRQQSYSSTTTQHLRGVGTPPKGMMKKPNRLPPNAPGQISSGCLLIPVFIAVWWYWTKKTYKRVIRGLLRSTPEPHQHCACATPTSSRRNNNYVSTEPTGEAVEGDTITSNGGGNYGYTRWEDMVGDHADAQGNRDTSERLVKWIHVGGLQRRKHKHELRNVTNRIVHGNNANIANNNNVTEEAVSSTTTESPPSTNIDNDTTTADNASSSERYDDFYDLGDYTNNVLQSTANWECLPSVPGNIELCSLSYRNNSNSESSSGSDDDQQVAPYPQWKQPQLKSTEHTGSLLDNDIDDESATSSKPHTDTTTPSVRRDLVGVMG